MSDQYLGEIRMFAGNFAPVGWQLCNGQLLPIAQYSALFSLLGTQYGGNGTSNFALPNLQGMVPMHAGQGPGLTPRTQGEVGGSPNVTIISNQVAAHQHTYNAGSGGRGNVSAVSGHVNTDAVALTNIYGPTTDGTVMSPSMLQPTPSSVPHENMQPYLVVNFIIAMTGTFPARN